MYSLRAKLINATLSRYVLDKVASISLGQREYIFESRSTEFIRRGVCILKFQWVLGESVGGLTRVCIWQYCYSLGPKISLNLFEIWMSLHIECVKIYPYLDKTEPLILGQRQYLVQRLVAGKHQFFSQEQRIYLSPS
jgi:hypothetical protein